MWRSRAPRRSSSPRGWPSRATRRARAGSSRRGAWPARFARMPVALRLQGITLPVPDLAAAEKFYRWVLAMKEAAEESDPGEARLGWGKEDRVRLVDATAGPAAREAISLRMEALDPPAMAAWLADRG